MYCAYTSLPSGISQNAVADILRLVIRNSSVRGYLAAATLAISIGPVTTLMVPTNFALIKMNEERGGARSAESARRGGDKPSGRSAEDSVGGQGEAGEFRDLSGPQERTSEKSSKQDDEKVRALLEKFGRLNAVRALLIGVGGVLGLITALAA